MQGKLLLLVPILIGLAGCSEKIEAQEGEPAESEAAVQAEGAADAHQQPDAPQDDDVDLKMRKPVGLD